MGLNLMRQGACYQSLILFQAACVGAGFIPTHYKTHGFANTPNLFADTKTTKNHPQQIIGTEFAGNFT